jgi:hypothetical protein
VTVAEKAIAGTLGSNCCGSSLLFWHAACWMCVGFKLRVLSKKVMHTLTGCKLM